MLRWSQLPSWAVVLQVLTGRLRPCRSLRTLHVFLRHRELCWRGKLPLSELSGTSRVVPPLRAIVIGRLVVGVGISALGASSSAHADRLHVDIQFRGVSDRLPGPVTLLGLPSASPDIAPKRLKTFTRRGTMVELSPGRWRVSATAEGFWNATQEVELHDSGTLTLELWPAGRLSGEVRMADPKEQLREVRVAFGSTEAPTPAGEARCPITEGRFECTVPQGTLNVRVGAGSMVPHYRWALRVRETGSVGRLVFVRGASISGWVVDSAGAGSDGAHVRLTTSDDREVLTTRGPGREVFPPAQTNAEGFFQLGPLSPGQYKVVATHTDEVRDSVAIEVQKDLESRLPRSLRLARPVRLDVEVRPPLAPGGGAWELRIINHSVAPPSHVRTLTIPSTGRIDTPLGQGRYALLVEAGGQRWLSELIELGDDPGPVILEIEVIKVTGTVSLGGEPLTARLIFGGRFGTRRVELRSDHEGRFEGHLPRLGRWQVDLVATSPTVERSLFVDIPATRHVDLKLADTALEVEVVDGQGQPVDAALVNAQPSGGIADTLLTQAGTDAAGRVAFHGLPAGPAVVSAERGTLMSEDNPVVRIREGEPVAVRLRLRETVQFRGRLVASGVPVPGGFVQAVPVRGGPAVTAAATTDASGSFAVHLPPGTSDVRLAYGAVGFATRLTTIGLKPTATDLALEKGGGTLAVVFDTADVGAVLLWLRHLYVQSRDGGASLAFLVHDRGSRIEMAAEEGRQRLVLRDMAPGPYELCVAQPYVAATLQSGRMGTRCSSGVVSTGSDLVVEAPRP